MSNTLCNFHFTNAVTVSYTYTACVALLSVGISFQQTFSTIVTLQPAGETKIAYNMSGAVMYQTVGSKRKVYLYWKN